jgi:hypothetical protein
MTGPLKAGNYHVFVTGYQPTKDAQLKADVLWRHQGAADQLIVTTNSMIPAGSDAGTPGDIGIDLDGPAVPAQAGDLLVLKVTMTSGTGPYDELDTWLSIP